MMIVGTFSICFFSTLNRTQRLLSDLLHGEYEKGYDIVCILVNYERRRRRLGDIQDGVLHSTKLDFYYFTPRIWHVFRSSSGTTINWTVLTTSDPGICIKFESFTVDTRTHLTRTRTLAGIISGLNTRLHTAGLINI